jgi:hypothetical protein|tara:strand:- start:253 stop:498 length:246 start_codon:yes stop_codon:yes gene_type:complete
MGGSKKGISFPMKGRKYQIETENGYYNPTSVYQAIQQKKNRKQAEAKIRMAKKTNLNPPQKSTRAKEPVQSAAFKRGYRKG